MSFGNHSIPSGAEVIDFMGFGENQSWMVCDDSAKWQETRLY